MDDNERENVEMPTPAVEEVEPGAETAEDLLKKRKSDATGPVTTVTTVEGSDSGSGSKEELGDKSEKADVPVVSAATGTQNASEKERMRGFYILSISYICFTFTDGALRTATLIEANDIGFSAFQIAIMFSVYEICGVFTNFFGGIFGGRLGLKSTLLTGLFGQIIAAGMLMAVEGGAESWNEFLDSRTKQIIYLSATQALSGVAKDMVKLAGKSVSKLVTSDHANDTLYKRVAYVTGFKNESKGVGMFYGTFIVYVITFRQAMATLLGICVCLVPGALMLSWDLGRTAVKKIDWYSVFHKGREFNILCMSRLWLFGSRDVWFEVAFPIFTKNIIGYAAPAVGAFMGGWTIAYGAVQSHTQNIVLKPMKIFPPHPHNLWPFTLGLTFAIAVITVAYIIAYQETDNVDVYAAILMPGLLFYGFIFAINSSIHSYLVVHLSDKDKVAQNVGFYYMSNAGGRLIGTLLGGVLYSYWEEGEGDFDFDARTDSFAACMVASVILSFFAFVFAKMLKDPSNLLPTHTSDKAKEVEVYESKPPQK
eukprot:Clim_evm16s109 gene=Clim_evmTU16s109